MSLSLGTVLAGVVMFLVIWLFALAFSLFAVRVLTGEWPWAIWRRMRLEQAENRRRINEAVSQKGRFRG